MSELIQLDTAYNLTFIKSIKDYLIFIKNLTNNVNKHGYHLLSNDIVVPVRWSCEKSCWTVDFGTQKNRDIEGIDLINIKNYYNEESYTYQIINLALNSITKEIEETLSNYNFKKSNYRFLALNPSSKFIDNNKFNVLGIYAFCENKKRQGLNSLTKEKSVLLDNSQQTLFQLQNNMLVTSYRKVINNINFNEYKEYLLNYKNYFVFLEENSVFILKDYDSYTFLDKNSYSLNAKFVKDKNLNKENFIKYLKTLTLIHTYEYFKSQFKTNDEIVLCYDKSIMKNIKLTYHYNIQQYEKCKTNKESFLFGVF